MGSQASERHFDSRPCPAARVGDVVAGPARVAAAERRGRRPERLAGLGGRRGRRRLGLHRPALLGQRPLLQRHPLRRPRRM